jgi:predicted Zn-dependent peptidase
MREEGGAYRVQCQNRAGFGEGYFALLAAFAPDKEERAVAVAEREIDRLRCGDITAGELELCCKLYLLQHLRRYESSRAQAYVAGRHLFFSSSPASWDRISDRLRAVTVHDVASAAQLAFVDRSRSVVLARPGGD